MSGRSQAAMLAEGLARQGHVAPAVDACYQALRNDDAFCYAAAWEYKGPNERQALHREALTFENVHLTQRSYK